MGPFEKAGLPGRGATKALCMCMPTCLCIYTCGGREKPRQQASGSSSKGGIVPSCAPVPVRGSACSAACRERLGLGLGLGLELVWGLGWGQG